MAELVLVLRDVGLAALPIIAGGGLVLLVSLWVHGYWRSDVKASGEDLVKGPFDHYIEVNARQLATALEAAIERLMKADGLSESDLSSRGAITHYPDGRNVLTIDGRPRIEWSDVDVKVPHAD